mmetsp:Transcript_25071/g.36979  ORF Transcript_25071/g.36979 Transcript_25071/m.36979 type:complete len:214 (+) Transcript_25071:62-703(+)
MFGRNDDLPLHGVSKKTANGVNFSTVNMKVVLSLLWVVGSLVCMYLGYLHCRHSSLKSTVICSDDMCHVSVRDVQAVETTHSFARSDLIDAELVRINDGKVVSTSGVKRKVSSKYGYGIQIKFKIPAEEGSRIKIQKSLLLSTSDMGRSSARRGVSKISKFIDGGSKALNVFAGRSWTFLGVACILSGLASVTLAFTFGQFSDPTPRRMRKMK